MSISHEAPLPPGRLGAPWLGESLAILRDNHRFYLDRFAEHGPVFKTRLFGIDFVVFSGSEAFHLFATDPRIERRGTNPLPVEQMFARSVVVIDGPQHRERKAVLLDGVWQRDAISAYLPRLEELLARTIAAWRERGSAHVRTELRDFAARLTAALYTGRESDEDVERLMQIEHDMSGAFTTLPIPLPWTQYGRAVRGRKRLLEIIDDSLARHESGGYDDALSRMLDSAHARGVPVEGLRGDLVFLLFAGQAGLSVPLTLATLALGQHPELMTRAHEEVLAVAPDGPLTVDVLDRLDLLGRISKEVRRYYPMNSATNFGRTTEPIDIGGYRVPAKWGAIGAIHITMRNPDVFAEPGSFDPDRFSPRREAQLAPGSYVPHGDGDPTSHRCPGEDLVTVTTKAYLALLLREMAWTIPAQDLSLTNEVFPMPASGLTVQFQRHSTA